MKKLRSIILMLTAGTAASFLSSCMMHCVHGSGHQKTETRKLGAFKKVDVGDSFKVIIKQDSTVTDITITADDNLIKYIRTSVQDETLRIYTKKNICNSGEITIKVPMKVIEGLKAADGAELTADGKITGDEIFLKVSDGAKMSLDVTAKSVITRASDSGELDLTGQAQTNDIESSDGSRILSKDFVSGKSTVKASDGAYVEVNALSDLNARVSDGANVKYKGTPNVNASKSDGGSVEKLD